MPLDPQQVTVQASSQSNKPTPEPQTQQSTSNATPRAGQTLDLRHITSNSNMAPPMKDRTVSASSDRSGRIMGLPQSLSPHRLGSRSPVSIPSSPTSVNSSSSAIFERDIEPPLSHHLTHPHPSNPHRTPRSKTTEPIDAGVPSVLDSAAELLTSTTDIEESLIAVEAPATSSAVCASRGTSVVGSPVGRGSRSPSPSGNSTRVRTSMLLNLPSPTQSSIVAVPLSPSSVVSGGRLGGSPPAPSSLSGGSPNVSPPPLQTNISATSPSSEPAIPGGFPPSASQVGSITPSSVGGSTQYESASSSPKTTTLEHPPHPFPSDPASPVTPTATNSFATSQQSRPQTSHPPSPSQTAHKRLSFLSYTDILASTPVTTQPLSALTSPATDVPPPHLPTVSLSVHAVGTRSVSASTAASMSGSARNSLVLDSVLAGHTHGKAAADVKEPTGGIGDDLGGEWEREGLGRGLEERLEALMAIGPGKA